MSSCVRGRETETYAPQELYDDGRIVDDGDEKGDDIVSKDGGESCQDGGKRCDVDVDVHCGDAGSRL